VTEARMVWKDLGSRRIRKSLEKELGLGMMSRDNGSSWCTHGIHMVTEIKEYDIRAHGYGMVALR